MMAFTVKDHGTWSPYTPDPLPEWANVLGGAVAFLRSDAGGVDWYDYRNKPNVFQPGSVLAHTLKDGASGRETVKAVFRDPSMAFPAGQRLIEISGADPDGDPLALFEEKTFDPVALTFSAPAGPTTPMATSCSRLGLKRAFEERGLWETVRAMIASDKDMSEDWNLATQIRITDPIVAKARAGLAQQRIGLSDADVQALVTRANQLVAPPANELFA
jgi:hypothetical protein